MSLQPNNIMITKANCYRNYITSLCVGVSVNYFCQRFFNYYYPVFLVANNYCFKITTHLRKAWLTINTCKAFTNTLQSARYAHLFWMRLTALCDYLKVSWTSHFWQWIESAREGKTKPFVPHCWPVAVPANNPVFCNSV